MGNIGWLATYLVWAQNSPRTTRNLDFVNDVGIPLGLLAAALLVLAIVVYFMKRWYEGTKRADDGSELLSQLRVASDDGELTAAELKLIKAKLAPGLRSAETDRQNGGDPAKRTKPTYLTKPKQTEDPTPPTDNTSREP